MNQAYRNAATCHLNPLPPLHPDCPWTTSASHLHTFQSHYWSRHHIAGVQAHDMSHQIQSRTLMSDLLIPALPPSSLEMEREGLGNHHWRAGIYDCHLHLYRHWSHGHLKWCPGMVRLHMQDVCIRHIHCNHKTERLTDAEQLSSVVICAWLPSLWLCQTRTLRIVCWQWWCLAFVRIGHII